MMDEQHSYFGISVSIDTGIRQACRCQYTVGGFWDRTVSTTSSAIDFHQSFIGRRSWSPHVHQRSSLCYAWLSEDFYTEEGVQSRAEQP